MDRPEYRPVAADSRATAFDVELIDETSRSRLIASNLSLEEAVELAKNEARRRQLGRMFRAGSTEMRNVIVISECGAER
jgi:hypothetical protein